MLRAIFSVLIFTLVAPVHAQEKKPTAQQERMAKCNKDAGAKALKGDERKKFMSECLKA